MKNLIILFILTLTYLHLQCQESYIQVVSGPGISVYLNGNSMGKTTAEAGGLMLDGLSRGRYALKVVKEGHLPDDREWDVLINYLGGESFAGRKLLSYDEALWRSPRIDATNESGFTVLPSGFRNAEGDFNNLGDFAYFWSSTGHGKAWAWYRYMGSQFSQVYRDGGLKEEGRSVRCVQD